MSLAWLKLDIVVGSIGKLAAAGLLFTTLGLGGCGDDPVKTDLHKGCTLNSDCNGGLVCSFGLCHQECEVTTDCPAGQRCVQTDKSNVCQLDDEAACHFKSDCEEPLVCAIDLQCRNQCQKDLDCLKGQQCADGVCAEPAEVTEDGHVKGAVGAGGEGGGGPGPTGGSSGSGGTTDPGMGGDDAGGMSMGGMPTTEPCVPGGACAVQGQPCQAGTIVCDAEDKPVCMSLGDAEDGVDCGTDKVCSSGSCVDCKAGDDCQPDPDNDCAVGTISCANGPSCDAAGNASNGTGCGTDKVCSSGSCVDCKVGDACDPAGQPCKKGTLACSNGPQCQATGNKDGGTNCGTDQVCTSNGTCAACVENGACTPANECHQGQQTCATGPNCLDTQLAGNEGTSCGSAGYNFCTAGSCVACQNGNSCVPTNPCHKGTLNCNTAPPTCNDSNANATDGLECGDNKSCISGACVTNNRVLSVTSGAVADAAIESPFSVVTVLLVDDTNTPVTGVAVTVTATAGAYAQASATNGQGKSQISGRVGRAIGKNTFTVSAPGATSVTFDVNGVAPTDKNIFTLVNINHQSGVATPGPGTLSKLYSEARALTVASDGTIYLADYCSVFALSPEGVLSRLAGSGTTACGSSGDTGPGTSALLSTVVALALDEDNNFLYIADQGNYRIRQVNLANGKIYAFAGGGANASPWGDPGPADAAYLYPTGLGVAPNGDVFIADTNSGRIRRVDQNTQIGMFLDPTGTCNAAGPLIFKGCGYYGDTCAFAWDKAGQLFLSGTVCGAGTATQFRGVVRVAADKSLTLIAGTTGAATAAEGGTATSAAFGSTPGLAFDKAGNLYLSTRDDQRVRRIDAVTTQITTVAGIGGTGGYAGEYVLGSTADVHNPTTLGFDSAGNLYFADAANQAIRGLWHVGNTVAPTGKLATTGGNNQSVSRDASFASLAVKVTDGANAVVPGVAVNWKRLETGSGLSSTGVPSTAQKTNAGGISSINGRVGLASGDYHFEASYADIHGTAVANSPQSFTVTAVDPAAGTIFAMMNFGRGSGTTGVPGPATFAKEYSVAFGVATATDGTIYVSDYSTVYKITSRGEASVFAGTPGSYGFGGDSGPATSAKLNQPRGLALDESNGVLYIADYSNARIRAVTLSDGKINTFAGGGAVVGDNGSPTDASIGNPFSVSVDADGTVYIPDTAHYQIRTVDSGGATIKTWFLPSYGNGNCVAGVPSFYYSDASTSVHFLANGDAYIAGYICQGTNTGATYGILLRKKSDGTFTRIAGLSGAGSSTGETDVDASVAAFADLGDMVVEPSGDLVVTTWSNHRVRRINMKTGKINTIAGDGTAGYFKAGDVSSEPGAYVPASGALVNYPTRLGIWLGHVIFADYNNQATRMIW